MGKVFSIEEFSVYDGPGIRMNVFLKGCPLSCEWCHNPEGQRFETEYLKGDNGCLACGACLRAGEQACGEPSLTEESMAVCPRHLVRRCGTDYTPEELTAVILKNAAILTAAGGGVTFSGGEPLAQAEFLTDCLIRLDGRLHRAVQTCGMTSETVFRTVLAHTDYVLYDLKLMDAARHKQYCGADNAAILNNYRILAASGLPFITRIPLIPTVNDTEENLTATAEFLTSCGVKRVELLPYNKFAGSKYRSAGRVYQPSFDETLPPDPHTEIWRSYEIEVRIL